MYFFCPHLFLCICYNIEPKCLLHCSLHAFGVHLSNIQAVTRKGNGIHHLPCTLSVICLMPCWALGLTLIGKTHKLDCPLQAIASEKNSWQRTIGNFLQSNVKLIVSKGFFLVHYSMEVASLLEEGIQMKTTGFWIDIKDLFYSIPHDGSFATVICAVVP